MATKRKKSEQRIAPELTSAYLARLEIENIRCFGPRQTLDLLDPSGKPAHWTIILGPNSSGKSTLLQCIVGVSMTISQSLGKTGAMARATEFLAWEFKYEFRREAIDEQGIRRNAIDEQSKLIARHWLRSDQGNAELYPPETLDSSLAFGPSGIEGDYSNPKWASHLFAYGVTRKADRQGLGEDSKELDNIATLFDTEASLINAEDWLLRLDYAEMRDAKRAKNLKTSVMRMLVDLLPLVDEIRISEDNASPSIAEVQFHTEFGWVRFGQLGHGYQTMIGWVVDLASRMFKTYPDSVDPLSEAAMVLVDEIDLHMHPKWQREIMGYLSERFPNVQFIATAHSPLILQGADENTNVAVLRREGDHVVIDNDPENVRNWRIDQILASDLFGVEGLRAADTDEALAERRRILAKKKLTKKDEVRLEEIAEQVGFLPGEETAENREAWDIVRRAAERLKKQGTAAE